MTDYELRNTDLEDIEDLLVKVEKSFNITFAERELVHIKTFGEMCDYIAAKIELDNVNDCTTQQAFYKLRDAIMQIMQIDKNTLAPSLELVKILPRRNRRFLISKIEEQLNVKLELLGPPQWVISLLIGVVLVSLVGLFIKWELGLLGLGLTFFGFWFSAKVGNELDLQTLGQVAEKMTRDNYMKARRNSNTWNKAEVEKVLIDLFATDLSLDKSTLTREAAFS